MFLANGYTLLYICLWTRALLAELDALEGIIVRSVRLCIRRIQLELAFIFFPEILTALNRLVVLGISGRIGFLAGGVRLLCRGLRLRLLNGCLVLHGLFCSRFGRLVRGLLVGISLLVLLELRQTAQALHMAAVQVEHVGLETGDFQTDAVILALLCQLFIVCFVDDLIRAVTGLLEQLIGIADNIIPAQICTVQDLFRLLVCFADDVLAHALCIDERTLEHVAVRLVVLPHDGMSHIPEDRHKHGLVLDYSLENNIVLQRYWQPEFQKGGFIRSDKVREYSDRLIAQYDVRSGQGSATIVRSMSGGNQQKAIIAREIDKDPKLLVAVQPTRGLDVGAIEYIHRQIVAQRDKGKAVLLVSLELDEVMNLSDRILVMYEGEVVGEFDPKTTTVQELGLYMAGARKQGKETK